MLLKPKTYDDLRLATDKFIAVTSSKIDGLILGERGNIEYEFFLYKICTNQNFQLSNTDVFCTLWLANVEIQKVCFKSSGNRRLFCVTYVAVSGAGIGELQYSKGIVDRG